jgi:uncharacterized protein
MHDPNRQNEYSQRSQHRNSDASKPWGLELNTYCMLMHLSVFAGFVIPMAGLLLPIIMWATNKDEHIEVHCHGLIIFNWMLSYIVYLFASIFLMVVGVGYALMGVLFLCGAIFTILGAIKANDSQYWPYPMSIDFFGVKRKLEGL